MVGRRTGTLAKDMLRVEVRGVMYAIEVSRIAEIINPLPIVDLPREVRAVLGVAEYREQVLVVVDLRRLFRVPAAPTTKRTKWVVVKDSAGLVGFVVDAVRDVFSSEQQPTRLVPELDTSQQVRGITSAYKHASHLVFRLDVDRLSGAALEDVDSLLPVAESP